MRYLSTIFNKLLTFRENFLPFSDDSDGACIFLMVMGSFTLHLLKSWAVWLAKVDHLPAQPLIIRCKWSAKVCPPARGPNDLIGALPSNFEVPIFLIHLYPSAISGNWWNPESTTTSMARGFHTLKSGFAQIIGLAVHSYSYSYSVLLFLLKSSMFRRCGNILWIAARKRGRYSRCSPVRS